MPHSTLATELHDTFQKSSRQGAKVDTLLVHHQASTDARGTLRMMISGSRQVSSNYIITNEGAIWLVVDEGWRAWTSGAVGDGGRGAAWDRRSITVEIENETGAPHWRISDKAIAAAATLLADLRRRYSIRYVLGHRDLYDPVDLAAGDPVSGASYPTFCPGPDTVQRILNAPTGAPGSVAPPVSTTRPPQKPIGLDVDGALGRLSIYRWQEVLGTPADGVISTPSPMVMEVQRRLNKAGARDWEGRKLRVDGIGILSNIGRRVPEDGRYRTLWALQAYLGTHRDGFLSPNDSGAVRELQRRLNAGRF